MFSRRAVQDSKGFWVYRRRKSNLYALTLNIVVLCQIWVLKTTPLFIISLNFVPKIYYRANQSNTSSMSLSLISGSIHICAELRLRQSQSCLTISSSRPKFLSSRSKQFSLDHFQISRPIKVIARSAMETTAETITGGVPNNTMKLLFVEMGVGYDQHGYVRSLVFLLSKFASSSIIPMWELRSNLENVEKIETGKMWHLRRWRLVRMQFLRIRFLLLGGVPNWISSSWLNNASNYLAISNF